MKSLERVFAPEGPLAAAIPGYRRRSGQMEMSEAIAATIESTGVLVAEAGTGTGKTFAYLVPALLAGGKVIVSTGTKTLQDQLFDRDLPAVREALTSGASIALLKGRANYVCLYRLRRAATEGGASTREEASQLQRIQRFAALTTTGDRADLPDVPEDAPIWSQATSTRDNCLGQSCPDYADCFVIRARRNALAAHAERSAGLGACARRAGNAFAVLTRLTESDSQEDVRWAEVFGQSAQLHVTPLHTGELFQRQMDDHPRAWIFTSATLAVGDDFGHFTRELGVPQAETRRWESPFRFAEQALLYLPQGLPPEPNDPAFTDAVIEAVVPVLEASGGRAFLLFTTLRALRRAHELLRGTLQYPLLVQGTGSRREPF